MGALGFTLRTSQIIGLDSAVFIYHFEAHRRYKALCAEVFDCMEVGAVQAVTSTVTLVEVLVQPLAKGEQEFLYATNNTSASVLL